MQFAQDIRLSTKDWDAFRSGYSPFRFDAVVDRADLGFPAWFLPNARGAVVPSAQVLKPISSHRVRPGFWSPITPDVFRWHRGALGYATMRAGTLWSLILWGAHPTALTFRCGSTPVMFRRSQQAMWFFRHWWDEQIAGRDAIGPHGYSWTPILPTFPDPAAVAELAAFKSSLEAADRAYWLKYDCLHGRAPARRLVA
jgi:hypothetical protein